MASWKVFAATTGLAEEVVKRIPIWDALLGYPSKEGEATIRPCTGVRIVPLANETRCILRKSEVIERRWEPPDNAGSVRS